MLASGLPLGVGAAVYLTEYAQNKRLVAVIEYAAETLSGIPSIIFGLVGMLAFANTFGSRLLAGALTLCVNLAAALIGPSGCGKSTFLKTLNRMNDLIPGIKITGNVNYGDQNIFAPGLDVNALGLSGGQQQRLCIARALAVEPDGRAHQRPGPHLHLQN